MVTKIFSRVNPERLLHLVISPTWETEREELVEAENFLQAALISGETNRSYEAHKHLLKPVTWTETIAQESWVVVEGKVEVEFFDINDELLTTYVLEQGDISITLAGGHGYRMLEKSRVVEFKSGPYLGRAMDKEFIFKGIA